MEQSNIVLLFYQYKINVLPKGRKERKIKENISFIFGSTAVKKGS